MILAQNKRQAVPLWILPADFIANLFAIFSDIPTLALSKSGPGSSPAAPLSESLPVSNSYVILMIQLFGFSFRKAFCKTVTENFVLEAAASAAVTSSATTAAASATIVRFGFRYYGRMGIQISVIAA